MGRPAPQMEKICRFCGFQEHVAKQFVNGCEDSPQGHEYVEVNRHRVGPVGPGTPEARMRALWEALQPYDSLLAEHGYEPFSSRIQDSWDYAIVRFFDAASQNT